MLSAIRPRQHVLQRICNICAPIGGSIRQHGCSQTVAAMPAYRHTAARGGNSSRAARQARIQHNGRHIACQHQASVDLCLHIVVQRVGQCEASQLLPIHLRPQAHMRGLPVAVRVAEAAAHCQLRVQHEIGAAKARGCAVAGAAGMAQRG
ncbi:hypothetical protein D3C72_1579090 [compost metagenome]